MPRVTMLATLLGSNDGVEVKTYEKGQTYDVSDDLAENFIGQGAADPAKEPTVEAEANSPKSAAGPTENKVAAPAEAKPTAKPTTGRGGKAGAK